MSYIESCIPKWYRLKKNIPWEWVPHDEQFRIEDKLIFQRNITEEYKIDGWKCFTWSGSYWNEVIFNDDKEEEYYFKNPNLLLMEQVL